MQHSYTTSQIADVFGLHPNTIRLYEQWGVISAPERKPNGYRVFTDLHIKQIEIVRIALQAEVLQNGLRKKAIDIIKTVANGDYDRALYWTDEYIICIEKEVEFSQTAIKVVESLLSKHAVIDDSHEYTRKKAAAALGITIDTLRNWELNGLITARRKENGYRIYSNTDIQMLTVIRELRIANYSLSAILRMTRALNRDCSVNVADVLNTPDDGEFIITACDKLVVSLKNLLLDAKLLKGKISDLKNN